MREGNERSDYAPLQCSEQTGLGFVYFLGSANGERIKIGWSLNTRASRLRQHAQGDAFGEGGDFRILALVRATKQAEGRLHSFFKPHLVAKNEVYSAKPLIPYVTWLRDNYFVSTTLDEFQSESGQVTIDPQAWLPDVGRESNRSSELGLLTLCDPWSFLPSRIVTGDDYYTPAHYVECIRKALGGTIDLDPTSHVIAQQIVQAKRFFTRDQRGELQPWSGRVYLNPPFSNWPVFVDHTLEELASGRVTAMVCLGAVRTLTAQYFAPLLRRADAICIIAGRTPFWGIATTSDSPTDGHFLLYFGPDVDLFEASVDPLGATWPKRAKEVA